MEHTVRRIIVLVLGPTKDVVRRRYMPTAAAVSLLPSTYCTTIQPLRAHRTAIQSKRNNNKNNKQFETIMIDIPNSEANNSTFAVNVFVGDVQISAAVKVITATTTTSNRQSKLRSTIIVITRGKFLVFLVGFSFFGFLLIAIGCLAIGPIHTYISIEKSDILYYNCFFF